MPGARLGAPDADDAYVPYMFNIATRRARVGADFFSPDGEPIDVEAWRALYADPAVRILGRDITRHGFVLTLWLGTDDGEYCCRACGELPPRIFGTAVYRHGKLSEEIATPTAAQARHEHRAAVVAEGAPSRPCRGGCAGS